MPKTINTKYFPFAPGLPYKIKNGRYVIPTMDYSYWQKALDCEEIVVAAYKGLFESLFSLSIFEAINYVFPGKTLYWSGNTEFNQLVYLNGLGSSAYFLNQEQLEQYPVPIFFDAEGRTYFNCLNNYIDVKTYQGEFRYQDRKPAAEQLFRNALVDWSIQYLPKWRHLAEPPDLKEWSIAHHFRANRSFVLFVEGLSAHEPSGLNWSIADLRSFSAMLRSSLLPFVVLTQRPQKYAGLNVYLPPFELNTALYLISKAHSVLSPDMDWLLAAMLMEKSVVGNSQKGIFDLEKNKRYLKVDGKICFFKDITPLQAFGAVKI